MKSNLALDILLVFTAGVMAFFVVPVFMIGISIGDYQFIDVKTFLYTSIVFSSICGVFFSLGCIVLHLLRLRLLSRYLASYLVLWVVFTGLFLPVSVSTSMVDPEINPVDKANFAIATIIVGLIAFSCLTKAGKYVVIFVSVVVFASVSSALFTISQSLVTSNSDSLVLSENRNILILSFDGVPGDVVSDLFREDSQYTEKFKDFVLFSNAVSQSPATDASMMGELFGVRNYRQLGENRQAVISKLEAEGLVDELLLNRVPDSYSYHYGWGKTIRNPSPIDTFDFFRYPIVRIWTRFSLYRGFFHWDQDVRGVLLPLLRSTGKSDSALQMVSGLGPKWDAKLNSEIVEYEHFVNELSVSNKSLSVRYLHFNFTHWPVDFDEKCQFRSDDNDWFINSQNSEGVKQEAICALSRFSMFVEKLKDLKIYDNSLIVLKSDHGKAAGFFDEYPNDLEINGHAGLGYNRYRPTLLIKDFAADKPTITVENNLVLLNDLAKTLCIKADLGQDCEIFPGINLLGDFSEDAGPYYLYVVKNSKSNHRFKTHVSVFVPSRKLSLLEAMQASDLISLSRPSNAKDYVHE